MSGASLVPISQVPSVHLERLEEESEALRSLSVAQRMSARHGIWMNAWALFSKMLERAEAINDNPNAFLTGKGDIDVRALGAWTKMIGTARAILSDLNKMQESNTQISHILDKHARDLIKESALEIGVELKKIHDEAVDSKVKAHIRTLMYKQLSQIFLDAATRTLHSTKEEFGLNTRR